MRDLIITACVFIVLVAAFSFGGDFEPQEQESGNFVMAVESGEPTPQPTEGTEPYVPEPTETTEPTIPVADNLSPTPTKTIEELAWEVIIGLWDAGKERKRLLGDQYEAVQKRVNEILEQERRNPYGD